MTMHGFIHKQTRKCGILKKVILTIYEFFFQRHLKWKAQGKTTVIPTSNLTAENIKFDWAEHQMLAVTSDVKHPASRAYCCVLEWGGKKKATHEPRKTFEDAEARTSWPVNLVFSRQTGFTSASIRYWARCTAIPAIRPGIETVSKQQVANAQQRNLTDSYRRRERKALLQNRVDVRIMQLVLYPSLCTATLFPRRRKKNWRGGVLYPSQYLSAVLKYLQLLLKTR